MERYEIIKDIGSGNFGVAKLVKEKWTGELYAVKFIERGFKVLFSNIISLPTNLLFCFHIFFFYWVLQIDEHVQREIINHRSLKHPNIIRFKEVPNSRLFGFNEYNIKAFSAVIVYPFSKTKSFAFFSYFLPTFSKMNMHPVLYAPEFSFVPEWNIYSKPIIGACFLSLSFVIKLYSLPYIQFPQASQYSLPFISDFAYSGIF